ncbi:MAG: glycine--tRNA ligase [Phycisphaerales bacterium JB054]
MTDNAQKSMEDIVSLCKRRGFVYPASEIYGGINGFWDYGPLGVQLKNNLRDAWWEAMVLNPPKGPDGERLQIVGLDSSIIQNPKVWEASGHVGGFNDPMIDCRESKSRYRADHLFVVKAMHDDGINQMYAFLGGDSASTEQAHKRLGRYLKQDLPLTEVHVKPLADIPVAEYHRVVGPDAKEAGTLTEPRAFNLMFPTVVGATGDAEDNKAYLRPETAQGIFINFKNVVDTSRVKVPFGIAQIGKAFRNEVTPRNFIFRSREFEQMEMEWFCHPEDARKWYQFWQTERKRWWESIGLTSDNLVLREHDKDELSHYAKEGAGTADVEYRYPFTAPGFGELEGVAHRSNFDLSQHEKHSGTKLKYFDTTRGELAKNGQPKGEHYLPDVIEPAAGLTRGVLALLCEAYTRDESRPSPEILKLHPRLAPIKAAVFPLVNKDGMPEVADKLHAELQQRFGRSGFIETDAKQSIGKRYARMDEAGCPWCFTIDGDTLTDQTVTARDRDSGEQHRVALDKVSGFLGEKLGL